MTGSNSDVDRARATLAVFAAEHPEIKLTDEGNGRWSAMLSGEHKRTIPVLCRVGAHTLDVQSFFMRAPDENAALLYAYLLRRNLKTYLLRFALHPDGDILLIGVLPCAAVSRPILDQLFGQLLVAADEAFDHALRLGFAGYIDREQSWRARMGLGRNPIT